MEKGFKRNFTSYISLAKPVVKTVRHKWWYLPNEALNWSQRAHFLGLECPYSREYLGPKMGTWNILEAIFTSFKSGQQNKIGQISPRSS